MRQGRPQPYIRCARCLGVGGPRARSLREQSRKTMRIAHVSADVAEWHSVSMRRAPCTTSDRFKRPLQPIAKSWSSPKHSLKQHAAAVAMKTNK